MHLSSHPVVGRVPACAHEVEGSGLAAVQDPWQLRPCWRIAAHTGTSHRGQVVEAVEVLSLLESDTALSSQSAELEANMVEVEWKSRVGVAVVVVGVVVVVAVAIT